MEGESVAHKPAGPFFILRVIGPHRSLRHKTQPRLLDQPGQDPRARRHQRALPGRHVRRVRHVRGLAGQLYSAGGAMAHDGSFDREPTPTY